MHGVDWGNVVYNGPGCSPEFPRIAARLRCCSHQCRGGYATGRIGTVFACQSGSKSEPGSNLFDKKKRKTYVILANLLGNDACELQEFVETL
jgi:hypothetical protein